MKCPYCNGSGELKATTGALIKTLRDKWLEDRDYPTHWMPLPLPPTPPKE